MFDRARADLRHYRDRCYPSTPVWRALPRILFAHPAAAAVLWYRFGSWAWGLRSLVLRRICQFVYLLGMPLNRLCTGVQIHPTTKIGQGLVILHFGPVVLTQECELGANCVLHQNVHIVTTNDRRGASIGNHFYAGASTTIVGTLQIEDNVVCGAGSVVTRSVPRDAIVGGVPARILRFRNADEKPPRLRVGKHGVAPMLQPPASPSDESTVILK